MMKFGKDYLDIGQDAYESHFKEEVPIPKV